MKKLLTVLIALSLVFSGFAAEPLANVDTVDFTGEASVTWGYNLDTEQTGFQNETDVELIINLLPGDMSKSTEGSGVWGELVLLVDGDTNFSAEADGDLVDWDSSDNAGVIVDVAKIHINDIYVGITSGDFDYDGGVLFPNSFNYDGDEDIANSVDSANEETGFDQGIVVGYANDMFNVEGSIRSNNGTGNRHVESFTLITSDGSDGDNLTNVEYFHEDDTDTEVAYDALIDGERYYRVVFDTDSNTYWTNQYAIGGYAEFTGVENLKVGIGGSYVLSGEDADTDYNKGDSQLFVGADYVYMLNDTMSIVPAAVYTLKNDVNPVTGEGDVTINNLTAGLAYRWGASEEASTLLADFYEGYLAYTADDDDETILPGVSVWADLSFMKDAMKADLPFMVNVYSGDLNGLKAYGYFYANIASEAGLTTNNVTAGYGSNLSAGIADGMQIGAAASYDIAVADMTVTPSLGVLARHVAVYDAADDKASYTSLMPVVRVDLAGAVSNTTFTAEWSKSEFKSASDSFDTEYDIDPTKGQITLKAKIAL